MPSQAFLKKLEAGRSTPRIKFLFDGDDYSEYIIDIHPIRRGTGITAGNVQLVVDNVNREWNRFISDLPSLAKIATLDLYFSDDPSETMRLYTGIPTRAPLIGTTAVLYLQDKMTQMLQKRIGSGEAPRFMDSLPRNPADFVWELLIADDGGELDDTENDTNPDILYSSLVAWESWVKKQSFVLKGGFYGETIRTILDLAADITGSRIWVDANGKFKFAPPYTIGTLHFSRQHCTKIDVIPETSMILNDVTCYYGFSKFANEDPWTSHVQVTDADDSQVTYGLRTQVNNTKTVYHTTEDSAYSYVSQKLTEYKYPLVFIDLKSDLYGLTTEIGNLEFVTERQKNLNNTSFRVDQTTINLRHQANDYSIDILGYIIRH
jgi:hypothetical protein